MLPSVAIITLQLFCFIAFCCLRETSATYTAYTTHTSTHSRTYKPHTTHPLLYRTYVNRWSASNRVNLSFECEAKIEKERRKTFQLAFKVAASRQPAPMPLTKKNDERHGFIWIIEWLYFVFYVIGNARCSERFKQIILTQYRLLQTVSWVKKKTMKQGRKRMEKEKGISTI